MCTIALKRWPVLQKERSLGEIFAVCHAVVKVTIFLRSNISEACFHLGFKCGKCGNEAVEIECFIIIIISLFYYFFKGAILNLASK